MCFYEFGFGMFLFCEFRVLYGVVVQWCWWVLILWNFFCLKFSLGFEVLVIFLGFVRSGLWFGIFGFGYWCLGVYWFVLIVVWVCIVEILVGFLIWWTSCVDDVF